jgi:enoyl-CoA hydratase/carnithine racemase
MRHGPFQSSEGEHSVSQAPVNWTLDERGVATVTFNRPEVNNAYNDELIAAVLAAIDALAAEPRLRVLRLQGAGKAARRGGSGGCLFHQAQGACGFAGGNLLQLISLDSV